MFRIYIFLIISRHVRYVEFVLECRGDGKSDVDGLIHIVVQYLVFGLMEGGMIRLSSVESREKKGYYSPGLWVRKPDAFSASDGRKAHVDIFCNVGLPVFD